MNILLGDGSLQFSSGLVKYLDENHVEHIASMYEGDGYRAMVTRAGLTQLLQRKGLTAASLGNTNTGKTNIKYSGNQPVVYTPIDNTELSFLTAVPSGWNPSNLPSLSDIVSDYEEIVDEFNDLFIRWGLLGLYSNPDEEFYFTRESGVYVPLDDTGICILQCFLHFDLDNYFVNFNNLSYEFAGNKYDVPDNALVELHLDNHKIIYTTLIDGTDEENHLVIRGRTISSQNKILKAHIFYECELKKVATPIIKPASGDYSSAIEVTISCGTEGATIHYTTDGTTPDENSPVYIGGFSVNSDTTVKAIAYLSEYLPSEVAQETYKINVSYLYTKIFYENAVVNNGRYLFVYNSKSPYALGKMLATSRAGNKVTIRDGIHITTSPATVPTDNKAFEITLKFYGKLGDVSYWLFYDAVNNTILGIDSVSGDLLADTYIPGETAKNEFVWTVNIEAGTGLATWKTLASGLSGKAATYLVYDAVNNKFTGSPGKGYYLSMFKYGEIPTPPPSYNITINPKIQGANVWTNKNVAVEGETIQVYVEIIIKGGNGKETNKEEYTLPTLEALYYILNGRGTPIDLVTKQFIMPAGDVMIDAVISTPKK